MKLHLIAKVKKAFSLNPVLDFFESDSRFQVVSTQVENTEVWEIFIENHRTELTVSKYHLELYIEQPSKALLGSEIEIKLGELIGEVNVGNLQALPELADLYCSYEDILSKEEIPYLKDDAMDRDLVELNEKELPLVEPEEFEE